MPLKKSELYASLWAACDELRGGMDASQYKDYVLVLLFMKYVSDKAAVQPRYELVVPAGGSFADMVALKGQPDIGDRMNKIIAKLAEANDLRGVIDVADFNDESKLGRGKEMVDRLSNLVAIFDSPDLDFSSNRADGDDLLGDAYEYLMRHFATESGRSKGQFYTPAEVSRVIARVIGLNRASAATQSIYDPTCGSGSLLLKAHDEARNSTGLDLAIYGQDMDVATTALARMNMILHDATTAEIAPGGHSTLASPHFRELDVAGHARLKTFDFVVANPPFSTKSWRIGFDPENDEFRRFAYGAPPPKNGDYAFLLHLLASMKSTAAGACILPHGVLFRGDAEGTIRSEIVKRGFVKGVIGLPANLFYGTGIPACIVVLDKAGAAERTGVFLIDASKGFLKDGPKNRLRAQDIHRIADTFNTQREVPGYARLVPMAEVEANGYNLNLARYIDGSEIEDRHDIEAHLRGGIPDRDLDALASYWRVLPSLRSLLFEPLRPGYSQLRVPAAEVRSTILEHPEFATFRSSAVARFERWWAANVETLGNVGPADRPKALAAQLGESLLATFAGARLLDPYDVYQRLMDYWAAEMQDDIYLLVDVGWEGAVKPRLIVEMKGQKNQETPDYSVGKQKYRSGLIPATVLVRQHFSAEADQITALEAKIDRLVAEMAELAEEHGVEGGPLEEFVDDNGKIVAKTVASALRNDGDLTPEERDLLQGAAANLANRRTAKAELKDARTKLDGKIAECYRSLREPEVKMLALDEKWRAALRAAVEDEVSSTSSVLIDRLSGLATRYATPLPELEQSSVAAVSRVETHLAAMGFLSS